MLQDICISDFQSKTQMYVTFKSLVQALRIVNFSVYLLTHSHIANLLGPCLPSCNEGHNILLICIFPQNPIV